MRRRDRWGGWDWISDVFSPALPALPRGTAELRLCAGGEGGELDDEPLHGTRGRRLRQARLERRGDVVAVRGGVLERGLGEPRGGALELGPRAHRLHAPPRAAPMPPRALDPPLEREHEHLPVRHRREEGQGDADRLREPPADDRLRGRPRPEPPPAATGAPELRYDRLLRQRGDLPQRAEPELPEPPVRVGIE